MKNFGDKNTFAIAYRPNDDEESGLPFCHFIIQKKYLGNRDEPCYLCGTWIPFLVNAKNDIIEKAGSLREPEFEGLSDFEILELWNKANQEVHEFNPNFAYLPQLSGDFWCKYRLTFDEILDSVELMIIEENDNLKILWRKYTRPKIIHGVILPHKQFYDTIEEFLNFMRKVYPEVNDYLIKY